MKNRTEAEAQGFTVDDTCYPWCAYKGSRFNPDEWHQILTDRESELLAALLAAQEHLEYCGYGDNWERECAKESKLEDKIQKALNKS